MVISNCVPRVTLMQACGSCNQVRDVEAVLKIKKKGTYANTLLHQYQIGTWSSLSTIGTTRTVDSSAPGSSQDGGES
jgi:hypothetical protein